MVKFPLCKMPMSGSAESHLFDCALRELQEQNDERIRLEAEQVAFREAISYLRVRLAEGCPEEAIGNIEAAILLRGADNLETNVICGTDNTEAEKSVEPQRSPSIERIRLDARLDEARTWMHQWATENGKWARQRIAELEAQKLK